MGTTRWISWAAAAELTGLPVSTIEHAVRVNRIRRRPQRGRVSTLDAASVEEWAAWYRLLQEQRKLSPRRAKSTTAPLPPGEWLSTAEAAAALSVGSATVLRHVGLGNLEAHRSRGLVWVTEASVLELAMERARWISWRAAAEILGCPRHVVPLLVEHGHLEQRPVHRTRPSVALASVVAYAPVFAEERAAAKRRAAEEQQTRRVLSKGPADGDVWLKTGTAALVMGLSRSRVLQLVHAELLPATRVGRQWWLRRIDVEQAAAARAFLAHTEDGRQPMVTSSWPR